MTAGLDLHLSDEQRALYEHVRALAADELSVVAASGHPPGDAPARVNRPLVRALAEHGLLDRLFADDREVSALELCLIREALARSCTEAETAFALQGLGAYPIDQAGSPELRERWIPRVADGTAVAAFALTEPDAGSDPGALSLRAEPDRGGGGVGARAGRGGGGYRLYGEKLWISNAPDADVYTVFARDAGFEPASAHGGRGARGVTAFAVPGDAEGLSGTSLRLLAPHAIGSLRFDGVAVTREQVLGEPGAGFAVAMRTLDLFRPSVGAFAIGMARAALDLAVDYARTRHTFGKPLRDHQAVAHRLADLRAQTEAARLLVHQAAAARDAGLSDPGLAAMSKLLATEVAQTVVDAAVQFHGAVALQDGHPLEHLYREVRAPRIYEGASEIQREIIARAMFRDAEGESGAGAAGAGARS